MQQSRNPLAGRVAFISGGSSGINLGIAQELSRRGAAVLVFGRDLQKAEQAARSLTGDSKSLGLSADVRNYDAVKSIFEAAAEQLGPPSIIVAGAAGNFVAPAAGMSANGFKSVVDIDLLGSFNVFRAAYDLADKPNTSMIAITAPQGVQVRPFQSHVCAAKAGVNMLVKCLAMEWGQAGIRVNAISPGPIDGTEGLRRLAPTEEARKQRASAIALRRLGTSANIADLAYFLCTDSASYITGAILDCDGGSHLGDASEDCIGLQSSLGRSA